jgi:hypothetical protein
MEIEAKWSLSRAQYATVRGLLAGGTDLCGYRVKLRQGGKPQKFVDVYYDTADGALTKAGHCLRHRVRYSTKADVSDNTLATLQAAPWDVDWVRVQYKSTPVRMGAVWFRYEADNQDLESAAAALRVVRGEQPGHPAIVRLKTDHPEIGPALLCPFWAVVDYRVRAALTKGGETEFDASLDRLTAMDLRTGVIETEAEAEVEIASERPFEKADVDALLALAQQIQDRHSLQPAAKSKGGIGVPDVSGVP